MTATTDATETNNVPLKSEGSFYQAGTGTGGNLDENEEVGTETKAVEVFSYIDPNNNPDRDKTYVVLASRTIVGATTTYAYTSVDVDVEVALAGTAEAFDTKVQAAIPEATDYQHIHFGVWAALGAAKADGSQTPSGLGIGFVQSIGDGMTGADMPNNGSAGYSGSWVATVQAADGDGNGPVSLTSGDASLAADFGMDKITATLTGLATLSGAISDNTFSGTDLGDAGTAHQQRPAPRLPAHLRRAPLRPLVLRSCSDHSTSTSA